MQKQKLRFKTPDEVEAVFYEAFVHCDSDVMAGLWADQDVTCVHPGAAVIIKYDAIISSWMIIFDDAQGTNMQYTVINRVTTDDIAVHTTAEEMLYAGKVEALVLATNVYRKFDDGWLMIGHHGSVVGDWSVKGETLQ